MTTPPTDPHAAAAAELEELLRHMPPGVVDATRTYLDAMDEAESVLGPALTPIAESILTSARADAILDELASIRVAIMSLGGLKIEVDTYGRGEPRIVVPPMDPHRAQAIRDDTIARVENAALTQATRELEERVETVVADSLAAAEDNARPVLGVVADTDETDDVEHMTCHHVAGVGCRWHGCPLRTFAGDPATMLAECYLVKPETSQ